MLKLAIYPEKILREKCEEIHQDDNFDVKEIGNELREIMHKFDGIGLAGSQVNLKKRIFVVEINNPLEFIAEDMQNEQKLKPHPLIVVNPRILERYGQELEAQEGCLSLPEIFTKVKRQENILIEFYNEFWEKKKYRCGGLLARCMQHEIDHLDGVMIIDYAKDILEKMRLEAILKRIAKKYH